MFLQALLLILVSFQYGRAKVFICGENDKVLVFWKGCEELARASRKVVLSSLIEKVPGDFLGDSSLEVLEGLFNDWVGPWGFPVTGDIKFSVEMT